MKKFLLCSSALAAVALPAAAHAQSTGSLDFEDSEIVVTGTLANDVAGVEIPDTPKAKVQIGSELIQRQVPGQTINDTLNLVPGVSFTNNDPFGSLGGSFTIRGFSSSRISQTLDGIPLNDSGNYALYTNQMVDPEIIEAATVSLGSTDVDSPTASAAGGTINVRTKTPDDEFGVMTALTYGNIIARGNPGDRMMYRGFIKVETGQITPGGLKAYFTASTTENDSTFSNYGGVKKQQYNGKIYQPFGDNGDFVSVSGHYNENRNNFNGSSIKYDSDLTASSRFYNLYDGTPCTTVQGTTDVQDGYNICGDPFERRYNPSNTGNIRLNSRFTLADPLVLTVDPFYQYVKANGGGTSIGYEGASQGGYTGVLYARDSRDSDAYDEETDSYDGDNYYYFGGVDLNGDGDTLDFVRILSPSQTRTRRYGVIANLAWELNENNRVRVAYTYDRANHRQTGTAGLLYPNAEPMDVFPINDPLLDVNGVAPQKRNRKSIAELHQISGEYRGEFGAMTVLVGARMPFFKRELNQYCVTTSTSGYVNCINGADAIAEYTAARPYYAAPQSRTVKYDKFLPNLGVTFDLTPDLSVFASFAKNLSVPGTDDLYGSILAGVDPAPETSDSYDAGLRFQSGIVQAQLSGWFNRYNNRLASAYSLECDCNVTRNLGRVDKYGIDGSIAMKPIDAVSFYVWGSYLKSEIKNDVQLYSDYMAPTAGQREAGAPKYMLGARVQGELGPVEMGAQVKRTGSRYLNDINTIKLPGYTTADLDLRVALGAFNDALDKSYLQFNVTNLFDEVYFGSAPTGLVSPASGGYTNFGSPRAFTASLIWGF